VPAGKNPRGCGFGCEFVPTCTGCEFNSQPDGFFSHGYENVTAVLVNPRTRNEYMCVIICVYIYYIHIYVYVYLYVCININIYIYIDDIRINIKPADAGLKTLYPWFQKGWQFEPANLKPDGY
jgi:hypothetical protein